MPRTVSRKKHPTFPARFLHPTSITAEWPFAPALERVSMRFWNNAAPLADSQLTAAGRRAPCHRAPRAPLMEGQTAVHHVVGSRAGKPGTGGSHETPSGKFQQAVEATPHLVGRGHDRFKSSDSRSVRPALACDPPGTVSRTRLGRAPGGNRVWLHQGARGARDGAAST